MGGATNRKDLFTNPDKAVAKGSCNKSSIYDSAENRMENSPIRYLKNLTSQAIIRAMNPANDERKFLHDISSPLGAAIFSLDSLLDYVQSQSKVDQEALGQIIQIYDILEILKRKVHERRRILIEKGE